MAEIVTFWLDNKSSAGTKVARFGNQILVNYRERFYIVESGAALTKAGKPLRYSRSSLPAIWKKMLRGDTPPVDAPAPVEAGTSATSAVNGKKQVRKEKKVPDMPERTPVEATQTVPGVEPRAIPPVKSKVIRKPAGKPAAQTLVVAECPYCNQTHEIPVEKGRNGKPFFKTCNKCRNDFAVRFVQVTIYQSQVAGFE